MALVSVMTIGLSWTPSALKRPYRSLICVDSPVICAAHLHQGLHGTADDGQLLPLLKRLLRPCHQTARMCVCMHAMAASHDSHVTKHAAGGVGTSFVQQQWSPHRASKLVGPTQNVLSVGCAASASPAVGAGAHPGHILVSCKQCLVSCGQAHAVLAPDCCHLSAKQRTCCCVRRMLLCHAEHRAHLGSMAGTGHH